MPHGLRLTALRRVVAVVLAAGLSSRFPGDKLLHPFRGRPLAEHIALTLWRLPFTPRLAICPSGDTTRRRLYERHGFEIVDNPDPARGMSLSLALGAQRALALDADAMLVCLADMPLVTLEHLEALLVVQADIVATEASGTRSPPGVFSRVVLPQLLSLTGDQGARHLLKSASAVEAQADLVRDFDTPADFG